VTAIAQRDALDRPFGVSVAGAEPALATDVPNHLLEADLKL
jgi:hypothetical protein